jgi:acyl dehydratase
MITFLGATYLRALLGRRPLRWDPLRFHVDEDVAQAGAFGGLIASGLHSMAILQRLAVLGLLQDWALIAGRLIANVQMTGPVRPGMTLRGTHRIDAVDPRGPHRSLIYQRLTLWHGDDELLSFDEVVYVARRPEDAAVAGRDQTIG